MGQDGQDPDGTAARLGRLEAREEILELLYTVGHAVDYGDETAWIESFTEDAVFSVHLKGAEAPVARYAGHEELRARLRNHTRPPELYHKHVYANPLVRVEGDTATCESYFLVVSEYEGEPVVLAFGRDRDELVRDGGRWRIRRRRAEMESKSSVPVWTVRDASPGASGVHVAAGA